MATDARISTALPSHPKTKKLVRQLGAEAGWSLVVLILWAAANRSDGDLAGMSDEDIELAADWDGTPGEFIGALRRIRFVDGDEGDCQVHDWTEHQPWAAGSEARSLKAKWNAVKRHHGEHAADREVPEYAAIRHAASKQPAQDKDASSTDTAESSNAPSPSPIRTLSESSPSPSPSPVEPRASRLAADWALPTEWREWAERERPDLDPLKTADQFRDYWVAKPGKDGRKLDWQATWRNWVRDQRAARAPPQPKPPDTPEARSKTTAGALRLLGLDSQETIDA